MNFNIRICIFDGNNLKCAPNFIQLVFKMNEMIFGYPTPEPNGR